MCSNQPPISTGCTCTSSTCAYRQHARCAGSSRTGHVQASTRPGSLRTAHAQAAPGSMHAVQAACALHMSAHAQAARACTSSTLCFPSSTYKFQELMCTFQPSLFQLSIEDNSKLPTMSTFHYHSTSFSPWLSFHRNVHYQYGLINLKQSISIWTNLKLSR